MESESRFNQDPRRRAEWDQCDPDWKIFFAWPNGGMTELSSGARPAPLPWARVRLWTPLNTPARPGVKKARRAASITDTTLRQHEAAVRGRHPVGANYHHRPDPVGPRSGNCFRDLVSNRTSVFGLGRRLAVPDG